MPENDVRFPWVPLAGSQALTLACKADRILLCGSRGSGKSETTLAYFLMNTHKGYKAHHRGIIIATSYKALDNLVATSKRMFPAFDPHCKFLASAGQLRWVMGDKSELLFRVVNNEEDYNLNIHGHSYNLVVQEELTRWPDMEVHDLMQTVVRTGWVSSQHSPIDPETGVMNVLPPLQCTYLASTNPSGPSMLAVRARYIDGKKYGQVTKTTSEVYNLWTKKTETITKSQVAIFSSHRENKYLPLEYTLELENIRCPVRRASWLEGSWNISSGGMYDDVFSARYNIVKDFHPEEGMFRIFRGMDYGQSAPFVVAWFAEAMDSGHITFKDGTTMPVLRGDVFWWQEYYGWNGTPNKGLRWLPSQIARAVISKELKLGINDRVIPGPSDSAMWNDVGTGASIAGDLAESVVINGKSYKGPRFTKANKSKGSRALGHSRIRTGLLQAQPDEHGRREKPGFFVCESCQDGFIRTLPVLPRCKKDMDDTPLNAEDHCFTGDTRVLLADGTTPSFLELVGKSGMIQTDQGPQPFYGSRLIGRNQETIQLTFNNATTVQCTPDHKLLKPDGTWIEAKDALSVILCNDLVVTMITKTENAEVYCLTVPTLGRFSLANGAVVANCADLARYALSSLGNRFDISGSTTGLF